MCKVTIGLPVYNGEKFIARSIDSLLTQKYPDFKLVISDNCSTDNTLKILKEFETKDERITLHEQKSNIGVFENWYFVFRKAKSEYFMWAADDDFYHPEFVSSLVKKMDDNRNVSLGMSATNVVDENAQVIDTISFKNNNPNDLSYIKLAMKITSKKGLKYNHFLYGIYRRDMLEKIIYSFTEILWADRIFICQIALGCKMLYIDKFLFNKRVHKIPTYKRKENDYFLKMFTDDRFILLKILCEFTKNIFYSPIIP